MNYGRRSSDLVEAMASDATTVTIVPESISWGTFKLVITVDGVNRFKLSKLTEKQIDITGVSTWKRDK